MNNKLDSMLRSTEFNQKLGQVLLEWAIEGRREAYVKIAKAGVKEAIQEMASWGSTSLPLVYVRDYLEDLIDVRFNDANRERIDNMNLEEFDEWSDRAEDYSADKKKALIPRKGYKQWFLDKWFATVNF